MWRCDACTLEQTDARKTCQACGMFRPDVATLIESASAGTCRTKAAGQRSMDTTAGRDAHASQGTLPGLGASTNPDAATEPHFENGSMCQCTRVGGGCDGEAGEEGVAQRSHRQTRGAKSPVHSTTDSDQGLGCAIDRQLVDSVVDGQEQEPELSAWDRMRAKAMSALATDAHAGRRVSAAACSSDSTHRKRAASTYGQSSESTPDCMLSSRPQRHKRRPSTLDPSASAAEDHELSQALRNSRVLCHMKEEALPEAPTYHPTAEEFADPITYIHSIRPHAQQFGACRIVPPAGWRPKGGDGVVPEDMTFVPRLIPLHKLQEGCPFQTGARVSVKEYREQADALKREMCGAHGIPLAGSGEEKDEFAEQIEQLFWRIVRTGQQELVIPYGADLHTSTHATGFRDDECGHWNLNRLVHHAQSLLADHGDIPGVTTPWLYVGSFFGAFCWHTEDLWMYSANHLHCGATKTWYIVPAAASPKFEGAARASLPVVFESTPDLLLQLTAMLSPTELHEQGVPVYQLRQRAGDFVVTFPRCYHAGLSHGYNIAEAVNFTTADWLPFARNAMCFLRKHKRTPVFSVERLLIQLAVSSPKLMAESTLEWVGPELEALVDDELRARSSAMAASLEVRPISATCVSEDVSRTGAEEEHVCSECQQILFLSGVYCSCTPSKHVCLRHAQSLQCCWPTRQTAWSRHPDSFLKKLCASLKRRSSTVGH